MLIIDSNLLDHLSRTYGEENMVCCFTKVGGMSAITQQAIVLLNHEKIIVLFIGSFTYQLVHKLEFHKKEISTIILKEGPFLDVLWKFNGRNQKWVLKIPKQIFLLGERQNIFINYLFNSSWY